MKKIAYAITAALVFVICLWIAAVPSERIAAMIENTGDGKDGSLYLKAEGLKKGLFYNFSAEKLLIKRRSSSGEKTLAALEGFRAGLSLPSLLRLSPAVAFESSVGGGVLGGLVTLTGKRTMALTCAGVGLGAIPALEDAGITGEGMLSCEANIAGDEGDVKFLVEGADIKFTSGAAAFVPRGLLKTVRGALSFKGKNIEVRSLAFEGTGIYARLKGSIGGGRPDMRLELMLDKSFSGGGAWVFLLDQYKVSPGYYAMPVRENLF